MSSNWEEGVFAGKDNPAVIKTLQYNITVQNKINVDIFNFK